MSTGLQMTVNGDIKAKKPKTRDSLVQLATCALAQLKGSAMEPITEDWLKANGFKWHQMDRQPDKHWLLWLGGLQTGCDREDLGLELAPGFDGKWFCWARSDVSHRYGRFLHLRYLTNTHELMTLVEALTGQIWNPEHHWHGAVHTPERAARQKRDDERLDKQLAREMTWHAGENDDSRGAALLEHRQVYE